jgi:hypothetical protein
VNEGEIGYAPSQVLGPKVSPDQIRSKGAVPTGEWAIYLEAEAWHTSLHRPGLNDDQLFDGFADPGLLRLSVGENKQADDNRRWRPRRIITGAHRVRGRRLSGREELRYGYGALGDQTISAKNRLTEILIEK